MSFQLAHGIVIDNIDVLKQGYKKTDNGLVAVISNEKLLDFVSSGVGEFSEPMFFFLELPCGEDEEKQLRESNEDSFHYKLYYLDNCTKSVIQAIIKRYGDLLANDGMCRFGFGSHNSGDEIYVKSYKVINIYSENKTAISNICHKADGLGASKTTELVTAWNFVDDDNQGQLSIVEIDGETVFDIPINLEDEGMYYSDTII